MSGVRILHIDEAPRQEMRYNRGVMIDLVNESTGSRHLDLHINVLRPGSAPGPYHYHERAENIYIILRGTARLVVEGVEYFAGPEQVVFIPPGLKHSTSNGGNTPLKLIEIYAPLGPDFHEVKAQEE